MRIIRQTAQTAIDAWQAFYSHKLQLYAGIQSRLFAENSAQVAARLQQLTDKTPEPSLDAVLEVLGRPEWGQSICSECGHHAKEVLQIGEKAWTKCFICRKCASDVVEAFDKIQP